MGNRALLRENKAVLGEHRALMGEIRALWGEIRALLTPGESRVSRPQDKHKLLGLNSLKRVT